MFENNSMITTCTCFKPPAGWDADEEYRKCKETVKSILVVNDVAERVVKLCSDMLSSAR